MAKSKKVPLKKRIRRLEIWLQRNPRVQTALRWTVSSYLRLVWKTARWQYLGLDAYRLSAQPRAMIMGCWHGCLAGIPYIADVIERPFIALASDHPDGLLIVEMLRGMGYDSILLSTSGDNTQPLRDAFKALRAGQTLGIATDGPLGPAQASKPGAVTLASMTGAVLVPVGFAARPGVRLGTWDGFLVPLPFARAVLSAGDPIEVPRRLAPERVDEFCQRLGEAIDGEVARCEAALTR